jgi:hypothetical protein
MKNYLQHSNNKVLQVKHANMMFDNLRITELHSKNVLDLSSYD